MVQIMQMEGPESALKLLGNNEGAVFEIVISSKSLYL